MTDKIAAPSPPIAPPTFTANNENLTDPLADATKAAWADSCSFGLRSGPVDQETTIIVGAGLSGLVAAYELIQQGHHVTLVDQENLNNLGGQAYWSLGGLFFVDSPEQRWMGIKDSHELALQDWMNSAQFDRLDTEDVYPAQWAAEFVRFAKDELRDYVGALGLRVMPNVGWAERGDGRAGGHGNSVPRFHLTWGTGPETVRVFAEPVLNAAKRGLLDLRFRHQVDQILYEQDGEDLDTRRVVGVQGSVLEDCADLVRGAKSSHKVVGEFQLRAKAVVVASGGIGHNFEMIKKNWPVAKLGAPPKTAVFGVPHHVDGRMLEIAEKSGASIINRDRMWHYTEGISNWNEIWPNHGIRIIPGPSSLWLDARGTRLPPPFFPGCDSLGTLKYICKETGYDYTWFLLDQTIIGKEFALSGSEQNPDITGKSLRILMKRLGGKGPEPVRAFQREGADFVVAKELKDLVDGMNELTTTQDIRGPDGKPAPRLSYEQIRSAVELRDSQIENPYSKDAQVMLIHNARSYWPDRYIRVAKPHRLLDPKHGPLIAVRLHILTRKTLGGLETTLDAQCLVRKPGLSDQQAGGRGKPFGGLYAVGEAAGFGGGGVMGCNALEGTFLAGCIFSGRKAGRAIAQLRNADGDRASSQESLQTLKTTNGTAESKAPVEGAKAAAATVMTGVAALTDPKRA